MKSFLISTLAILLSVATIVHSGPIPDEFKDVAPDIRETCTKLTSVSTDLIEKAGLGDFVEDDKLKCYLKCLFDQFRLLSPKGFNFEAMLGLTPPKMKDAAVKAVKDCRDTTGKPDDMCDLSFNLHKCFYNSSPDQYFIM
uniref:Odorant binding protein n=1 Tax=Meteorus pulchricornis TaxID=51522 RepID=A0A1S5VFH2_9HYME